MKYNLVPSGNASDPDIKYIYILPSSFEASHYSIAYPSCKTEDILNRKIIIRTYKGCSPQALGEIKSKLKKILRNQQTISTDKVNMKLTFGIGVFILGIVNWFIPDPLPFIDELLFTLGGGLLTWKSWSSRRTKLPLLEEQIYRFVYNGGIPEVEMDGVLSIIFKAIKCKHNPLSSDEKVEGLDSIELESLWITRYLNLQDHILSGNILFLNLKKLMQVLEKVFPIKKLVKIESINKNRKIRERIKNLKQDVIEQTGISENALAVYIELYRTSLSFLD
jgi:hypothetical protein